MYELNRKELPVHDIKYLCGNFYCGMRISIDNEIYEVTEIRFFNKLLYSIKVFVENDDSEYSFIVWRNGEINRLVKIK